MEAINSVAIIWTIGNIILATIFVVILINKE